MAATTRAILSPNLALSHTCDDSTSRTATPTTVSLHTSLHGSVAGLGAVAAAGSRNSLSLRSRATAGVVRAAAVAAEAAAPKQQQKSQYDITTLTTWLLKKEQAGVIDGELTIVLSSISLACKKIASLVQRAGISNLTGLQGAANIQGEDQKKLDVISNEVRFPA